MLARVPSIDTPAISTGSASTNGWQSLARSWHVQSRTAESD